MSDTTDPVPEPVVEVVTNLRLELGSRVALVSGRDGYRWFGSPGEWSEPMSLEQAKTEAIAWLRSQQ